MPRLPLFALVLTLLGCSADASTSAAARPTAPEAVAPAPLPVVRVTSERDPLRRYDLAALRAGRLDHVLHGVGPMWEPNEVEHYIRRFAETPPLIVRMGVDLAPTERTPFPPKVEQLRSYLRHYSENLPLITITWWQSIAPKRMRPLNRELLSGLLDDRLDLLVELVREQDRPVFLRVGSESNTPKSGHEPRHYVRAYRYVVDYFRAHGADNAIFMWNYKALQGDQPSPDVWYPGDAWVDWWSLDVFSADFRVAQVALRVRQFLRMARDHGKPVMLPESCPSELDIDDPLTWEIWFEPFFDMIHRNPGIRAFCYSNRDFSKHVGLEHWRDMRLDGSVLAERWQAELRKANYLHAAPRETP